MSDGAGVCHNCGRTRWAGERFCPGCGTEQQAAASDAGLIDLDADIQQASGAEAPSGRRDSLLGIAALAAIIVVVGLLFALGNNAADELSAPDMSETTPTAQPTPTAEPTATPPPRAATASAAPFAITTPRPGTVLPTLTPSPPPPASDEIRAIAAAVTDLDMGQGWLVAIGDPRAPVAINLETGEVISIESPFVSPRSNAVIAASEGLYVPTSANVVNTWSLVRWDGSPVETSARFDNAELAFGTDPSWSFIDEDVGTVAVHLVGSEARPRMHAMALRTGESREIPLQDPLGLLASGGFFTYPGIRTANSSLLIGSGGTVWRWTFNGGWEEFAQGEVRLQSNAFALALDCANPSDCSARLISARTGELVAELPDYSVDVTLFGNTAAISPTGQQIAQFSSRTNATYDRPEIEIYDVAGNERRQIGQTDFNWWQLIGWSPNAKFLIATGEGGVTAIDVANDEVHILTEQALANGAFSGIQLALLPTIERVAGRPE